jgi:hypothetical protein
MRQTSAILAIIAGALFGSIGAWMILDRFFNLSVLVFVVGISVGFCGVGIYALRGGNIWFLRYIWVIAMIPFLFPTGLLTAGNPFVWSAVIFFTIGLTTSLFAKGRPRLQTLN